MCSISGIWKTRGSQITEKEITDFNNVTSYRGPDGDGVFIDAEANLALGHRRLSIIDLSDGGRQPMFSRDENLVITFNGEIYNYLELKEELKIKGHSFRSNSDTEVILAAYEEWGEACQLRFNGMWAFAIWNRQQQSLFLSRDRFGVKPLYYVLTPGRAFAFASESVAFKALPGFKKETDNNNLTLGIKNSFYLEMVGETIYKDIKKLLPGHCMTVAGNGGPIKITRWWQTQNHLTTVPKTYVEQVEQFRELFVDACRLRLRSDVPVGIALSGGLDSSSVYSTVQQLNNDSVNGDWKNAFVASFPGTTMDEKVYADQVIEFHHGKGNYIYPHKDDIAQTLFNDIRHEDFVYLSPPVVHNIYKEMRNQNVVVSLDGHGADEALFGYTHMIYDWMNASKESGEDLEALQIWAQMTGQPVAQGRELLQKDQIARTATSPYRKAYNKLVPEGWKRIYRKQRFNGRKDSAWLLNYFEFSSMPEDIPQVFSDPSLNISYREVHQTMPTLLRNWDRASMRHGIEIRMPFLDWRLMSYIFSLPHTAKFSQGYSKRIVRDAMKGWMPESIRLRRNKIGINAPMEEWFNGILAPFILEAVNSASFLQSDIWNGPLIRDYVTNLGKEKKWNWRECLYVWPYINAWILCSK